MPYRATLFFIVLGAALILYLNFSHVLDLYYLQSHLHLFKQTIASHPIKYTLIFALTGLLFISLMLPSTSMMTLLSGALFGFTHGLLLMSVVATIGACFAFLLSRYLFQDFFSRKFRVQFEKVNAGFKKDGILYLFSLRLMPMFPFFSINLLMGLTGISFRDFLLATWIGTLPSLSVYTYAGLSFAKIKSAGDIFSPPIFITFFLVGSLPIFSKWIATKLTRK